VANRQISPERKHLYALGMILTGVGLLLFMSNFIILPLQMSRPTFNPFQQNPGVGFALRAAGGILLVFIGQALRAVGARGAAGSGLVLDPEQAREDLEPWARAAGGLVKDALEEISDTENGGAAEGSVIKVRCPHCRTLNDEDARFCKQCGASL